MPPRHDVALGVALDQRQRSLDEERKALSRHLRALQEQAQALQVARASVQMVLHQIDAAQRPAVGIALAVAVLGDLERMLDWCEAQVLIQQERFAEAHASAEHARGAVAVAHQQVRALELVLAARKAERAQKVIRAEIRLADETASRVHARNVASR